MEISVIQESPDLSRVEYTKPFPVEKWGRPGSIVGTLRIWRLLCLLEARDLLAGKSVLVSTP
jgi:hypothetical protein